MLCQNSTYSCSPKFNNMKTKLLYLLLLIPLVGLSQAITVNTTTYSVPELVSDVLVSSPCLSVTNVNWRTGTNFGSSNGIGYFENTNPNFPMQSGVILSTGSVMNAPGPNSSMLNDGLNTWPGDNDLESVLADASISMSSINATVLEFEFTALSPHFDFDFLFASEEYGNFQCQFSDAFAFLLTNLSTGVTTNLAIIPGTNTPISVVTVRDFLYNSACPSANSEYFGTFNGGANANLSPINFNGQTVVMNASAILSPNTPYKIKLVVADRIDPQSDSAIFLSANSFNIGQNVLGTDLTVAANTALCDGESFVINSGLNPAEFTFVWKRNNVVIPTETGSSLTVTQSGTYELTYTNSAFPCQTVTDSVLVEFNDVFSTPNPIDILKCDTNAVSYQFNLAINTPIVNAGLNPNTVVSYHSTAAQAHSNSNPLPAIVTSSGNQTVYVRIKKHNSDCFVVKSFQLLVTDPPIANQIEDLISCENLTLADRAWFTFGAGVTSAVLGGQNSDNLNVSYHRTLDQATNNTNAISNFQLFTVSTTIYVRVQNATDSTCFSIAPINLVVQELPLVDSFEDVIVCVSYTLEEIINGQYFTGPNGTGEQKFAGDIITETQRIYIYNTLPTEPSCPNQSSFLVTIIDPDDLSISAGEYCNSYILPELTFGQYFTSENGSGTELFPGMSITTTQTVHLYYLSTEPPFCAIDLGFDIEIIPSPEIDSLPAVFDCSSYILPSLTNGTYYDAADGMGNIIEPGTAITETQTIYIYSENGICTNQSSFTVYIGLETPSTTTECVSFTLPPLSIGGYFTEANGGGQQIPAGTVINSTQTIFVYVESQSSPNCTENLNFTITISLPVIETPIITSACEVYTLPLIALGNYYSGPNGTGTQLPPGTELTESQTVYIFLNNGQGCQNSVSFQVTVLYPPQIDSRSDIDGCNNYVLTDLALGNYYTGPSGTGTMLQGGEIITTSQMIYIYAEENGCTAETSFQINVFEIQADSLDDVQVCNSYILPTLTTGNFYYTAIDGPNGFGTLLAAGTAVTSTQTIFIYKENEIRPAFSCIDQTSFTVSVYEIPDIATIPNVNVCNSYVLPSLSVGNYYTEPNGGGTLIEEGTELTVSQTLFVYAETGTTPNCSDQESFTVTIFNVDELEDVTSCSSYVLPTLTTGRFYNGPNGTGGQLAFGSSIISSQTVYIYAQSGFSPNCSDESSFEVTIIPTPVANSVPASSRTFCDEDGTNDGVTSVILSNLNDIILGTQTGAEFTISYYATVADATAGINAILDSELQTVYVRVNNTLAPDCFDINAITFIIHKIPEPTPVDGIVCVESETGNLLNPFTIVSGLSSSTHTFEWYLDTALIAGATGSTLQVSEPGIYNVIATNNATGCSSEPTEVEVVASEPAAIDFTVSMAFSSTNSITINATGVGGNYEYSLDGGPFQDSPTFDNVSSGTHMVTVRDKNGCGSVTDEVLVINYPKFFTPNGDGFNETWNINDLDSQLNAVIFIYDRYGKLLSQIYPSKNGWDGFYNGAAMPSSDYWFTVSYEENNQTKEFKSHFSLKR